MRIRTHALNLFSTSSYFLQQKFMNFCEKIIKTHDLPFQGYSLSVIDLTQVDRLLNTWNTEMPTITPYYAIKANPDPLIIKKMKYFDCASGNEIRKVLELDKNPKNIIYANTAKRESDILSAKCLGIEIMTADSSLEIEKILKIYPTCGIVLRICPNDEGALNTKFSSKFGVIDQKLIKQMIFHYRKNIRGFSFHIGSGQQDVNAWKNALQIIDNSMEFVQNYFDENMYNKIDIIDIGGGFSTDAPFKLSDIYSSLSYYRKKYSSKTWIAECGRYFCKDTTTLLCPIISKKYRGNQVNYVIGNSIYHSFSGIIWDKQIPRQLVEGLDGIGLVYSTIFGETCDGIDIIYKGLLPANMEIGDVLIIPNMGAYCESSANNFNGFSPAKTEHYDY